MNNSELSHLRRESLLSREEGDVESFLSQDIVLALPKASYSRLEPLGSTIMELCESMQYISPCP